jgi:drug/metabolite transporter (DMT)-like permease
VQPNEIALIGAATLLIGTADFFGGIASRRSAPLTVAAWSRVTGLPVIVAVALVAGGDAISRDIIFGGIAGLGSAIGVAALYRGFSRGAVGVVAPTASITAAVVPIIAGLIESERPSLLVSVGLVLAVVSSLLVAYVPHESAFSTEGLVHGVVAGAAFGVMAIMYSFTTATSGLWPAVSGQVSGSVLAVIVVLVAGTGWKIATSNRVPPVLAGVLGALGVGAFVAASQTTELIMLAVVLALFPTVTVVLAAVFLKERLTLSQWMGVAMAGSAVVLISAF